MVIDGALAALELARCEAALDGVLLSPHEVGHIVVSHPCASSRGRALDGVLLSPHTRF